MPAADARTRADVPVVPPHLPAAPQERPANPLLPLASADGQHDIEASGPATDSTSGAARRGLRPQVAGQDVPAPGDQPKRVASRSWAGRAAEDWPRSAPPGGPFPGEGDDLEQATPPRDGPPPLPHRLAFGPEHERQVTVDGFHLDPASHLLVPSFLASVGRAPLAAASDAGLTGLGWTDVIGLESGLQRGRWSVDGRWAPPMLSARPTGVGLGGPVVADAPDGAAVSAPRGEWRASGLVAGPLAVSRLGLMLSADAWGIGLPASEAGLADGGRARQALAFATHWIPARTDRLELLLLGARQSESPDCFRCTAPAARVAREIGGLVGAGWRHALSGTTALDVRISLEHHQASHEARASSGAPSHLDLSRWITDGAPGALGADLAASASASTRTRLELATDLRLVAGAHRIEAGIDSRLETDREEASVPGSIRFVDRGSPCGERETSGCAFRIEVAPVQTTIGGWAVGGHLSDGWQLGAGWSLRAGARLDLAQASGGAEATGVRLGLGPRIALVWNVGEESRHWLLVHAGRSHDTELSPVVARAVQPPERVIAWTGDAFASCDSPGPSCVRLGGPAGFVPGGLPHADQAAVGWRGRFGGLLHGGLEARWTQVAHLWAEEERALLTDAGGQWLSADGEWRSRRWASADPRAWRTELALAAWARARAGPVRMSLAWSVSRLWGTASGSFEGWLADPRTAALAEGALPGDRRHRAWLELVLVPHPGLELGARLRYETGAPLWETFSVHGSDGLHTVRTPRGSGVVGEATVALRDPDLLTADAWLRIRLGALLALGVPRLDLTVEAARMAGGNAPVHLSATESRLGTVLRREPPFHLVIGLRAGD